MINRSSTALGSNPRGRVPSFEKGYTVPRVQAVVLDLPNQRSHI